MSSGLTFNKFYSLPTWARITQSVPRLATGWTFRGSNPGGGEIFRTSPDRSSSPTQPPIQCVTRLFPGNKAAGAWRWPPTPSSAEVKEKVELYLYSPTGPSWPVLGRNWPLPLHLLSIHSVYLCVLYGNSEQTATLAYIVLTSFL
jgi:hypothetical protein